MEKTESTIVGLKYNVKRFHNRADLMETHLNITLNCLAKAWAISKPLKEEVWDFITKIKLVKHVDDSSKSGLYTSIGPYTNKSGKTIRAHYSLYGNFVGIVGEDDKPRGYSGNIPVIRRYFKYVYTPTAKCILDYFAQIDRTERDVE
jgi:hypothetical protein